MVETRAIIIEDDNLNGEVLVKLLRGIGVKTIAVNDGRQALDALRSNPSNLIFLDLELGAITGYQVFEAIKANRNLQDIPVIAYSAYVNEMSKTRQMGFDGFLSKPLSNDRFPEQFAAIMRGEGVWE
jgi:two-component system cell cycle response regulator DivK